MNTAKPIIDHETSLVFAQAARKRIAAITEERLIDAENLHQKSAKPASNVRELLALQQQALQICLVSLSKLQRECRSTNVGNL